MDLPSGNDIASYKRFLETFCEETNDLIIEDDNLPIKIVSYYLREEEIEGECLGWSHHYLSANGCPEVLSAHICRSVFVEVSKCNVSLFLVEDDGDDEDKEDERENGENYTTAENSLDNITFLDIRKLLKEVINMVHKVCRQWKTQLPPIHINHHPHEVCVHAVKNTRRKMEDVHVICSDLNALFNLKDCPSHSYYSVFDGHGGIDAALYAASHLHTNLIHHPTFLTDPVTALKDAYTTTDKGFLIKARKENLKSGTTGVTVLKQGSKVHIAWLGDSQAVLVRNGKTVGVMNPHKPERADEKDRIEKLGGVVVWYGTWRVNGAIAVARAIGDKAHKPYICSDADVFSVDLDGTEDYIVLACDGVWDVLTPNDIPEIVYNHVQENHGNKSQTAHRIIDYAKENGSNDNISVIVVFFRDEISIPQGEMFFNFSNSAANNTGDREQSHSNENRSSDNSKEQGDNSNTKRQNSSDQSTNHSILESTNTNNPIVQSEMVSHNTCQDSCSHSETLTCKHNICDQSTYEQRYCSEIVQHG